MHPESRPHTCNLLLVEDQFDLATLMEQALQREGDQVTHAYSVFDALGLLDTRQFDGAVLDIELRDGVVFPVADRLAELGVPYLFVSAVYDQLVPARHRQGPAFAEPFHLEKLQQAVQHALSGSRATASPGPDGDLRNPAYPQEAAAPGTQSSANPATLPSSSGRIMYGMKTPGPNVAT